MPRERIDVTIASLMGLWASALNGTGKHCLVAGAVWSPFSLTLRSELFVMGNEWMNLFAILIFFPFFRYVKSGYSIHSIGCFNCISCNYPLHSEVSVQCFISYNIICDFTNVNFQYIIIIMLWQRLCIVTYDLHDVTDISEGRQIQWMRWRTQAGKDQ